MEPPTPHTSPRPPWMRDGAARVSLMLSPRPLLLEGAEQLVRRLHVAQPLAERLVAEQPRQAREQQQVGAALLAGRDEQEEQIGLAAVEGIEIDTGARQPEHRE